MSTESYQPRKPEDFQDPTFTPHREDGSFAKLPPPPVQIKKVESDPNWEDINPDIIRLCQRNGMARGALNHYLSGGFSWLHCLETMVVALGKELVANQDILVEQRNEYMDLYKSVTEKKHLELMDKLPGEREHEEFFASSNK
jgi:hypothetical protein